MQIIKPVYAEDRHCRCGALVEIGMRRCRKCRARSRWVNNKGKIRRRRLARYAGQATARGTAATSSAGRRSTRHGAGTSPRGR